MADRGKKAKVDDEDASESFDKDLVFAIEKLQEVQDELEKVNEEASEKVLEVEQKYSEIRRPVYQKRSEIIKGITDFWLTAFLSHPALSEVLSEQDQQVLKFLQSLDVEDSKDVKSGYSITFTFRPNPYFEDNKLVKTFRFSDDGMATVIGTEPKWKDGMDFTNGEMHAVGTKRSSAEESFFKWFSEKDMSDGIQDEVADIIREDLWPNPLKYFNNDQDEDEDDDEDDDDDEEFDEEGGEDDEGQGEEEEDDLENDEDDEDE